MVSVKEHHEYSTPSGGILKKTYWMQTDYRNQ